MSFLYPGVGGEKIRWLGLVSTPIQSTMICWIKPTALPVSGFATLGTIQSAPSGMLIDATSKIRIFQNFTGGLADFNVLQADSGLAVDTWLAIAMLYDGSSTSNVPLFYSRLESDPALINRTVNVGGAPTGTFVVFGPSGDYWSFGGVSTSYPFDGRAAYVQIFDRLLSVPELNSAVDEPGSIVSGLVLEWDQQDDPSSDHTADDSSGNGYDGDVGTSVVLDADNPTLPTPGPSVPVLLLMDGDA